MNVLVAAAITSLAGLTAVPATAAPRITLVPVAGLSGLSSPVQATAPRGDRRIFVVEQSGTVRVRANGRTRLFLDLRRRVLASGEQGLLSIAFHPRYATNGRFYVYYTSRPAGDIEIWEIRARGNRALASGRRRLLVVRHREAANHNGGQLAFGGDGLLYAGTGDGGGGDDEFGHAQDPSSPLGKLLRIDVDRRPSPVETVGIGLRNPWRFSFDRRTGDLWMGDVGQGTTEEIDFVPAPIAAGLNFGWSRLEGSQVAHPERELGPGTLIAPIFEYGHDVGSSITGGVLYRGRQPALRGRYVYGDYVSRFIAVATVAGGTISSTRRTRVTPSPSAIGESGRGEILVAGHDTGRVYRLIAR